MLHDFSSGPTADGERSASGRVTEIVADVVDIFRTGLLGRQQAADLARLAGRKARDDVALVHLVDLLEVLFERRIELLCPMACDAVKVRAVLVEVVALPVGGEHQPQPRRITWSVRTGKRLDERDRGLVA